MDRPPWIPEDIEDEDLFWYMGTMHEELSRVQWEIRELWHHHPFYRIAKWLEGVLDRWLRSLSR